MQEVGILCLKSFKKFVCYNFGR